ncbi:MAG TPA: deoxyguanosinetriphosphate triphosphohydrolase [Candidatus Fusicatenibacter merdavium]|uniref:Deoxyguanosinetriphosphate triphosphohydrolase-like protein n=1 Tax=Candidatus Fusicatenibacter merdavium TaxID=2838600 RepID=A0A9D2BJH0_9FIRM|nr:deoxyguanosinetriphosphate triphosphohydrolase [Candidatus Fusicatenibacter merdavium]
MNIRETFEEREFQTLSSYASHSRNSRGRERYEPECDIRTVYQRDRDRILHSKAFRRLKDKTQVFLSPQGDHYRTRLTHTLEVSQTARTVARALKLNEDLVEAIALGHDLGHTPFGHAGEAALNAVHPGGFKHAEQSVRVVEVLEKDGQGLNLTWEVRDGILNHRTAGNPSTLEGQVVRLCDKISYIHHDMDDAIRAGILSEDDIPITLRVVLGDTCRERLNTLIHDIVESSYGQDCIRQSLNMAEAMKLLRELMFANVYRSPVAKKEEVKVKRMLTELYEYYTEHPEQLSGEYRRLIEQGEEKGQVVCDYISGMTDQYSIHKFEEIFVPKSWAVY